MDFEQAMKRLTEISELMGKSDLKLEDSMKLYTEAVELTKKCKEYIKHRNPNAKIFLICAKTGEGIKEWAASN